MRPTTISSRRNDRVKAVNRLGRRKERDRTGTWLAEGSNAVEAARDAGGLVTVFLRDEDTTDAELTEWVATGAEVVLVTASVMDALADTTSPPSVVAVVRQRLAAVEDLVGRGVLVVLEAPNDPGNLGTIIRTADAAGCTGVVVTGDGVDVFHPKVARAAAGSLSHVPLARADDVAAVATRAGRVGQPLVGLDLRGTHDVFDLAPGEAGVALVFGTERHGLSDAARDRCDELARIPQFGRAESLNLGVAAGITIYAAVRGGG